MATRHWLGIVLFCSVAAAASTPLAAQPAPADGSGESDALVHQDLQQLAQRLASRQASQGQRDEAAHRLVSRGSPPAREILLAALVDERHPEGQLAVARALAGEAEPDPRFINPLFALIGPRKDLSDAAAAALSTYKTNGTVSNRLISIATTRDQPEPARTAAIRALGTMTEKRSAEVLVGLVAPGESQAVRDAAADALAEMTGLRRFGRSGEAWQQWWQQNAGKPEAEWKAELLHGRAQRYDQTVRRHQQLTQEVQNLLREQYQLAPDPAKLDILLRYMNSPEPEIRSIGAQMIHRDAIDIRDRGIPQPARQRLIELVGDSSPSVRLEVARAIHAINDPDALQPLLAQLAQEPQAEVRAAIARALGPIRNLAAVPELLRLLGDESPLAAEAAAGALRDLAAQIREREGAMLGQTSAALRQAVDRSSGQAELSGLRQSAVEAMAPLRDPSLFPVFASLLRQTESPGVRRGALRGLGELRDPRAADTIVRSLQDDPDPRVRLEAVRALGGIPTFEHAEALHRRLSLPDEPSELVRDEAWRVLETLFPHAPEDQLASWADRFPNEPVRRLSVLAALAGRQAAAGREESLAITRENIGETLMHLDQPERAAAQFKLALEYWQTRNAQQMVIERLVTRHMQALLRSRQYADAMQFAVDSIARDAGQRQTMGSLIRSEAERLRDAGDLDSALALIESALAMSPPLPEPSRGHLDRILRDVLDRQNERRTRAGPQSAGGPLPLEPFFLEQF